MIKIEQVMKKEQIKKDDILMMHDCDRTVGRVDCIDGEKIFFIPPHNDFRGDGEKYLEFTWDELQTMGVIYKFTV